MSALEWTDIQVAGAMPSGYCAGFTPTHRDIVAMVADGWRVQEHQWLGNGYVRVRMYRAKPEPRHERARRVVFDTLAPTIV